MDCPNIHEIMIIISYLMRKFIQLTLLFHTILIAFISDSTAIVCPNSYFLMYSIVRLALPIAYVQPKTDVIYVSLAIQCSGAHAFNAHKRQESMVLALAAALGLQALF